MKKKILFYSAVIFAVNGIVCARTGGNKISENSKSRVIAIGNEELTVVLGDTPSPAGNCLICWMTIAGIRNESRRPRRRLQNWKALSQHGSSAIGAGMKSWSLVVGLSSEVGRGNGRKGAYHGKHRNTK